MPSPPCHRPPSGRAPQSIRRPLRAACRAEDVYGECMIDWGRALRVASISLVVACAGPPTKTYPGPELPRSDVALLKDASDATVLAIDGVRPSGSSWFLLPGPHTHREGSSTSCGDTSSCPWFRGKRLGNRPRRRGCQASSIPPGKPRKLRKQTEAPNSGIPPGMSSGPGA